MNCLIAITAITAKYIPIGMRMANITFSVLEVFMIF